jgi:hypothetical protein
MNDDMMHSRISIMKIWDVTTDNLIVSWEQSIVLCAGSALQLAKQSLDEAPYKLS